MFVFTRMSTTEQDSDAVLECEIEFNNGGETDSKVRDQCYGPLITIMTKINGNHRNVGKLGFIGHDFMDQCQVLSLGPLQRPQTDELFLNSRRV
jgi:hypothetical protein